ncbi:hypothetical protein B6D52_02360 [Candidatus Parcubacteria bacterium 4484_255]|nr:MAG: hypothetical protein B6D52_02360 [Candidatus Parcubacteria bacterium 4484_255]
MHSKYIKSLNLNKKKYGGICQRSSISDRTKISRKCLKEMRLHRIKQVMIIFFSTLFLGSLIYIVFFSSVFRIKNIKINKTISYNLISDKEIESSLQNFINQSHNNLIFFKCADWRRKMSDDSRLESLNIKKKWPNSVEINVQETQPLAILEILGDSQHYYLNKRGGVIKAPLVVAPSQAKNSLSPIFYDKSQTNVKSKLYANFLKKLLAFVQNGILPQNGVYIQKVNFNNIGDIFDAQIVTKEGWQIFINSETNLEKQLVNLLQILEEEIEDRSNLEYIDLRFGAKMFYKLKGNNIGT